METCLIQLDQIDRKLLRAFQGDSTLSTAALAERVGASQASCWRRMKVLEGAGVLGRRVCLLDSRSVGLTVNVLCSVRMKNHLPENTKAFQEFVHGHREIMECYSMSGDWDYLMRVVAADVASYETFLMRDLLTHPAVATASSHFALSQVKYTTEIPV